MVLNQPNQEFVYNGQKYYIGQRIYGTAESEYEGLFGSITEIRDGEDRETENETPDIYCSFDPPDMPCDIDKLEALFSDLYGEPKTLEDITLDLVIMAPEMIEPVEPDRPMLKIYVITEEWAHKNNYGISHMVVSGMKEARKQMRLILRYEIEEGYLAEQLEDENFIVESSELSYEAYEDGYYDAEHYKLYIEEQRLYADSVYMQSVATAYREIVYEEDYAAHLEQLLSDGDISEAQYQYLSEHLVSGEQIRTALEKNDAHWDAYWQTIINLAEEVLSGGNDDEQHGL